MPGKVYARLKGGLGNQCWQIAAAIGSAVAHGREWACLPGWGGGSQGSSPDAYRDGLFSRIPIGEPAQWERLDEYMHTPGEIALPDGDCVMSGYWQNWRHWDFAEAEVRAGFEIPRIERQAGVCVIHYRGGDYLDRFAVHDVCGKRYYRRSITALAGMKFLLVTDDPVSARARGLDYPLVLGGELEHFLAIATAEAVIMANSTFSWWASYLGSVPLVIAPRRWYGPQGPKIDSWELAWKHWLLMDP